MGEPAAVAVNMVFGVAQDRVNVLGLTLTPVGAFVLAVTVTTAVPEHPLEGSVTVTV